MPTKMHPNTNLSHAGCGSDPHHGGVTPPIHLATTFERDAVYAPDGPPPANGLPRGFPKGYIYSRVQSPTRAQLERALAQAEGAFTGDIAEGGTKHGFSACATFASGQAAAMAILMACGRGTHLVLADDVYHGVRTLVIDLMSQWGLSHSVCDASDLQSVSSAVTIALRECEDVLVWVETPSNPLLKMCDIAELSQLVAQLRGQAKGAVRLLVDATWMTPCVCRPLELGADMVMHSLTKYAGGHSDLLGGAIIMNDETFGALHSQLRMVQTLGGGGMAPMDCWLCLRGLRSMHVRIKEQCASAAVLANYLTTCPAVTQVYYPGLKSHPGHSIALKQMKGFGGMLSFELSSALEAREVCSQLQLFKRATSLGGTESLVEHRRDVEGQYSTTPVGLIRVSVGLEHVQDLIADLTQAMQRMTSKM
eukprot:TRINITY_DN50719_c0_g1_i1.p1 TRINITY_DN50719_c0_g1~~TRINITY_DN50719_c0_g1_i1.p1  ORF type:complete len:422 (+),score=81.40 TRINITY_DN50719_c0_g1_i1:200-1465(+)